MKNTETIVKFLFLLMMITIPASAFADEEEQPPFEIPTATGIVEVSGGVNMMMDIGPAWSVSAMIRFGRLLLPLEVGVRVDGLHFNEKKLHALVFPVRVRHDWYFTHVCSWDLHYGIDLAIQDLNGSPIAAFGYWIGTAFNYHFSSRQALGIGISYGHIDFDRNKSICDPEYPCSFLFALRASVRYTF